MKMVTVFGSSKPVPGEPDYEKAYQLGKTIAQQKYGVITGGYMGTMEAVSKGASAYGGEVIGVTCEEIEKWRPVGHNAYVQRVIHCLTLDERIHRLIREADAGIIALPGGIGTMAEIAMFWNHKLIHPEDKRPMMLVGQGWQMTFEAFFEAQIGHIPENAQENVHFMDSEQEAFELILNQNQRV
jgi:uncharacterized protein (TIGR00730 family)